MIHVSWVKRSTNLLSVAGEPLPHITHQGVTGLAVHEQMVKQVFPILGAKSIGDFIIQKE